MTLSNPKPLGWAFGEILTSAQMNSFGTQIIRALDGTGGGAYTLAAPLSIDGDTVELETCSVTDELNCSGDAEFTGSYVLCTGDVTISGILTATGNVSLGNSGSDTLNVNAVATFQRDATFQGNVTLGNAGTDTVTLTGVVVPTGTGRVLEPAVVVTTSASVDVAVTRHIYANPGGPGITYTLSCTDAQDSDYFEIYNASATNAVSVAGLVTTTCGAKVGLRYVRISGAWQVVRLTTSA
jgi:hypothetical protein